MAIRLMATMLCAFMLVACGGGGGNPGTSNGSGGTTTGAIALYMTAPSAVVIAVGDQGNYSIGGGTGPYTTSSSNTGLATASVSAKALTIQGVAQGTVVVSVFDSTGKSVTTSVTVGPTPSTTSLYTTASTAVTTAVGSSANYNIGGGTAPYTASSSDVSVATANASGKTLTLTGVASGTAHVSVFDSTGANVGLTVTVGTGAASPLYIIAPGAVTLAPGVANTKYTIGGGSGSFSATSSNTSIAAATVSGTTLSISTLATGTAQVLVFDASSGKSANLSVTVGNSAPATSLFLIGPSAVTVPISVTPTQYIIGGGTAPYYVSSNNTGVATVSSPVQLNGTTTFSVYGVAAGYAKVNIFDSTGASIAGGITVTVGSGVASSTYIAAPASVTMTPGQASTYAIGGGTAPYSVQPSNQGVATAGIGTGANANTLTITGVAAGTAQISVFDANGVSAQITVNVGTGSPTPLYVSAPSDITIAASTTATTYTISGGSGVYSATSSNLSVATASASGTTLSVTGVAPGSASVQVSDTAGTRLSPMTVTVTTGSSLALYTTAPGSMTIAVSNTPLSYSISGGTAPYTVVSNNMGVVTASTTGTNGATLNITGVSNGTGTLTVSDAVRATQTIQVTVAGSATALFTNAPPSLTMTAGTAPAPFTIGGGVAPYTVSNSNVAVATGSLSGSNGLSIAATAAGQATVYVFDSAGKSYPVSVTVVAASAATPLYIAAPVNGVTIAAPPSSGSATATTYTVGGGSGTYNSVVTSSIPGVATASLSGNTLSVLPIAAGGPATIVVRDSLNATASLSVTVGATSALISTAPATLTLAVGATSPTYTISGGNAPYVSTSSNPSIASGNVVGTSFTITAGSAAGGPVNIGVIDATGNSKTVAVTVGSSSAGTPFTTAPSAITLPTSVGTPLVPAASTYTISGGTAPYRVSSSNTAFVIASVTTGAGISTLNITGIGAGTANVLVTDAAGVTAPLISVTVTPLATTALNVLPAGPSSSPVTANVGDILNFIVSGGSPNYAITVNNPAIALLSAGINVNVASLSGIASGTTFKVSMKNVGSTSFAVVDSLGQTSTVNLSVAAPSTLLRLSPSAEQIGEDFGGTKAVPSTGTVVLSIYGGTAPYAAYTSDLTLTSVTLNGVASPPTITVDHGSNNNYCITPINATTTTHGTYAVTITVVDSLGASAVSILTIADNGLATCPN
jgi:hypothetical protein